MIEVDHGNFLGRFYKHTLGKFDQPVGLGPAQMCS